MKRGLCKNTLLVLLLLCSTNIFSQQSQRPVRELIAPAVDFFVPHWYVSLHAGGAYDIGEAKFADLLSPALQATIGYEFNEFVGARLGVSGLWARNDYAYPQAKYKWNFVQPAIDVKANLTNIFFGRDIERVFDIYAFLGGGVALSYNNDDAEKADQRFGIDFQKLWSGHRWNPVVRGGLGADFWMNDNIALSVEGNVNMLPDHFNSKLGKHDNRDWHINALVGVRLNLGPSYGITEPQYREIPQPVPVVEPPVEEPKTVLQDEDMVALVENVQFELNKSVIRSSEYAKIMRVIQYLNNHPQAHVELTGFADKPTGNATINQRLSVERAQAVAQFISDRGISSSRISRYAKGDRVQPFQVNEDNRVTICIVIDEGLTKDVQELRESIK